MAATLIETTDLINVSRPPVLIYGQPGAGKTSLAQTATKPLTLDFDGGIHRSQFRKTAMRFDTWEDVIQEQKDGRFDPYETIVVDTVDTLLKYTTQSIIRENAKNGTRSGGLTISGWGVLKTTFDNWLSSLRQSGKQIILIAHQKEERDGDAKFMRPDIAGGSYSIVMQGADIVGYVSYRNNKRHIAWEPTDAYFAKNAAQLESGPIPDFNTAPNHMGELLDKAKYNLGRTAEASAESAKIVETWEKLLAADPTVEELNALLPNLSSLTNGSKKQAWHLISQFAEKCGLVFDKKAKTFGKAAA
jgi:hypothetical protein